MHKHATKLFCVLMLVVAGCSDSADSRARVWGKVTLDGAPIEEGTIAFFPIGDTRGPSSGGAIANGAYDISQIKGPTIGTNRVEIHAQKKTGRQVKSPEGNLIDERLDFIPARYNTNTSLQTEVATGDHERNFELTSTGGK